MTYIYDIYTSVKSRDRDRTVLDRITHYMSNNVHTLSDGMIRNTTIIAADVRDRIAQPYNIGPNEWKLIQKSKEYPKMSKLASNLRLGLLISYIDTKDIMFLNFFMVLAYSSLMSKYFKNGYDRNIMKYTLDMSDARMDFKRYEGSILIVINKKVESFINLFKKDLATKNPTDRQLREWMQSLTTRMNDSVKAVAKRYYKNFNDPDTKIMMEYTKTEDGKNILSPSGVLEAVRQNAVNNLMQPSDTILNMVGLPANNIQKLKYRRLFIQEIPNNFGLMSGVTSAVLDEWMKRNREKMTLQLFRTSFLKSMSIARGIEHIMKQIDTIVYKMLDGVPKEDHRLYNKQDMKRYLYLYVLGNIYFSSKDVL